MAAAPTSIAADVDLPTASMCVKDLHLLPSVKELTVFTKHNFATAALM
jgi:hypothetical protein